MAEVRKFICFGLIVWSCLITFLLLVWRKPADLENFTRPRPISSVVWCPMARKPRYDLQLGAYCNKPKLPVTTLAPYQTFSRIISDTAWNNSCNVHETNIDRFFYNNKPVANVAYKLMKWGIMRLKPNPDDLWLEFGVHTGFSINMTAVLRGPSTGNPVHGFDAFQGLPDQWRSGYVQGVFSLNGMAPPVEKDVRLHVGWFNETLEPFLAAHPGAYIAHANIDMDIYSGAVHVLRNILPRCRNGSVLHFHELFSYNSTTNVFGGDEEMAALYDVLQTLDKPMELQLMPFFTSFKQSLIFRVR
jgi:hypothetical protein